MRIVAFAVTASVIYAPTPTFEVATIRPSGPQDKFIGMWTYPGGRVTASNETLRKLLQDAFDLQDFQISGGPA
jgi:uncharacterized protein (TIGR03435 family)